MAVKSEDLLLMGTTFARDAIAAERSQLQEGSTSVPSDYEILTQIVPENESNDLLKALEQSGGLAELSEIFGQALDNGDELSKSLELALDATTGNIFSQQASVPEILANYLPYLMLAGALIRVHYSRKKGLEFDIPNPAVNKAIEKICIRCDSLLKSMLDMLSPPSDDDPPE